MGSISSGVVTYAAGLQAELGFRITVYGWERLCEGLVDYPTVLEKWSRRLLGTAKPPSAHSGISAVPKLPPHYQPRTDELAELKLKLLAEDASHQGITASGKTGLQGMGGIGKTVLAAAV